MFCKNCGKELTETAAFCGGCGTATSSAQLATAPTAQQVAPANQTLTYDDLVRFQQAKQAKDEYDAAVQQAYEWQAAARADLTQVKNRYNTCLGLAVIIAVITIFFFGGIAFTPSERTGDYSMLFLAMAPAAAVLCGAMSFGFCPIIDFFRNHGFFVIFTWAFVICAFAFLLMIALFAGIPCFFMQRSKVKKAEAGLNEATEYLNALLAA